MNTNIAPVVFFDSRGAPGDYAGSMVSGLLTNCVKAAARVLRPDYNKLSAAEQKVLRMVVEQSPVVEIVTAVGLLQHLEALCPSLDFTDLALTIGDVSHELNAQACSGNNTIRTETFRMEVGLRGGGGEFTRLMVEVFGDHGYDPKVYRLIPYNGDPARNPATVVLTLSAKNTLSHGFRNRRARNGIKRYQNRAFYRHLVGATLGKPRPYTETGVQREFTIEHLGGGVWAQRDYQESATFLLPKGTVFRDC